MPKIIFIEHNGTEHVVEAQVGTSIMQAAINNLVPGIEADCGGLCACATCHVYIDPEWLERIPVKSQGEAEMIANIARVGEGSRLACQLQMRAELDGIVIRLPESQY
jgi:2Fe-2S ferredoxin